mmetsp:Transcript_12457/g.46523  ORF Transcript_12457/g.46523 Transcript_12457/m.46523 type:complete len:208 (-) Transcript_12457:1776-2399(-)
MQERYSACFLVLPYSAVNSAWTSCVTGWCDEYSIVNSPFPWVMLLNSVLYPNMFFNGTIHCTTTSSPSALLSRIVPFRLLTFPITVPWNSLGTVISTRITGSRILGLAFSYTCRNALSAASLNAISLESTAWLAPSVNTTRMFSTGCPINPPVWLASLNPLSHARMYPGEIAFPMIPFSKITLLLVVSFPADAFVNSTTSSSVNGST